MLITETRFWKCYFTLHTVIYVNTREEQWEIANVLKNVLIKNSYTNAFCLYMLWVTSICVVSLTTENCFVFEAIPRLRSQMEYHVFAFFLTQQSFWFNYVEPSQDTARLFDGLTCFKRAWESIGIDCMLFNWELASSGVTMVSSFKYNSFGWNIRG